MSHAKGPGGGSGRSSSRPQQPKERSLPQLLAGFDKSEPAAVIKAAKQLCMATSTNGGDSQALALLLAVKKKPWAFRDPVVCGLVKSWLRPPDEVGAGGAAKTLPFSHSLGCNILMKAFRNIKEWPLDFLQLYMDDAMGPRAWVQDPKCQLFVQNLRTCWAPVEGYREPDLPQVNRSRSTSFAEADAGDPLRGRANSSAGLKTDGAGVPSRVLLSTSMGASDSEGEEEEVALEEVCSSEKEAVPVSSVHSTGRGEGEGLLSGEVVLPLVCDRYEKASQAGKDLILTCLKERLYNAGNQSTWQVIVTLVELSPLSACRILALQHLQKWLHSPALSMYARSLLTALVSHIHTETPEDFQAVEGVLSLRLKTSQQTIYQESLVLLIQKKHAFFRQALKHFILAEVNCGNPPPSSGGVPKLSSTASNLGASENFKVLASLLQAVGAHGCETKRLSTTAPPWLTRATVAQEFGSVTKELALDLGPSGFGRIRDTLLQGLRIFGFETVDLVSLGGELLRVPKGLLNALGPAEAQEYLKLVKNLVSNLLALRVANIKELTKAAVEHLAKQRRSNSDAEEFLSQKRCENWRFRLLLVREVADLHECGTRYCLQLVEDLYPRLANLGEESSNKALPDVIQTFRSMLLLDKPPSTAPTLLVSGASVCAECVAIKDSTCRNFIRLSRSPRCSRPDVITHLDMLIHRSGKLLSMRESDPLLAKASGGSNGGLGGEHGGSPYSPVELSFPDETIVTELFSLADYQPSLPQHSGLVLEDIPPLAHIKSFWQVTLMMLVISSCNPATVGKWLWHNCPTMRCLMQMVVCSQYQFPPPGAANALAMEGEEGGPTNYSSDQLMLDADAELTEEELTLAAILRGEERQIMPLKKKRLRSRRSTTSVLVAVARKRLGGSRADEDDEEAGEGRVRNRRSPSPMKGSRPRKEAEQRMDAGEKAGGEEGGEDGGPGFMFLKLDMPARKPPLSVLEDLKRVDQELGIGARFRRSTEPDFVAASIAGDDSTQVSRSIIENSIGWLAPAVAAEPDVTIKRLPMGCICHMLMMSHVEDLSGLGSGGVKEGPADKVNASGRDASRSALSKLMAPLQKVVMASLFEGSQCLNTVRFFMEELRDSSSQRRTAARRALEALFASHPADDAVTDKMDVDEDDGAGGSGSKGEGEGETAKKFPVPKRMSSPAFSHDILEQAQRDKCSWVFLLDRLPPFQDNIAYFLRSLFFALEVEGSHHVISFYLMALHTYCHTYNHTGSGIKCDIRRVSQGLNLGGDFAPPSFFSFALCHLLATRKLVMSTTALRFQTVHDLMVADIIAALNEAKEGLAAGQASRLWGSEHQIRYIFPGGNGKEVMLPESLLVASLTILAMHTGTDLPDGHRVLLCLLFPEEGAVEAKVGAGYAVNVSGRETLAVSVEQWVQLAKCECPTISAIAARFMPTPLLPRLLLCSGLSVHCFQAALARVDNLGQVDATGEVYGDLLAPASTAAWGMAKALGTRKTLIRRLYRRITAYLRLGKLITGHGERGLGFYSWLRRECGDGDGLKHTALEGRKGDGADARVSNGSGLQPQMMVIKSLEGVASHPPMSKIPTAGLTASDSEGPQPMQIDSISSSFMEAQKNEVAALLLSLSTGAAPPSPVSAAPEPSPQPAPLTSAESIMIVLDGEGENTWDWETGWVQEKQEVLSEAIERLQEGCARGSADLLRARLESVAGVVSACVSAVAAQEEKAAGEEGIEMPELVEEGFLRQLFVSLEEELRALMPNQSSSSRKKAKRYRPRGFPDKACVLSEYLCQVGRSLMTVKATARLGKEVMWRLVFIDVESAPRHLPQPVKALLLTCMQKIWGGHEVEPFVRHLLRPAANRRDEKVNAWAALSFLNFYLRHAHLSPMQGEESLRSFTVQGAEGGRKGKKRTFPGSNAPAPRPNDSTSGHRYSTPSSFSTDELFSLLSHFRDGLRASLLSQSPDSPSETSLLRLCLSLLFYMVHRSSVFRLSLADALAAISVSAGAHGGITQHTGANEFLLFRMYLAFPDLMVSSCRNRKVDDQTLIILLNRGQTAAARSKSLSSETASDRLVMQGLVALSHHFDLMSAIEHARDDRVTYLSTTARKHPFLLLRQIPQIIRLLQEDATPLTSRPPTRRALLPGHAPSSAEYAVTVREGQRVSVWCSHWGSHHRASLWQGVLEVFTSIPVGILIAHQQTVSSPSEGVWALIRMYMKLVVAQGEEASFTHLAPIVERLGQWLELLRRQDPAGFEGVLLGHPIEAVVTSPPDILMTYFPTYREAASALEGQQRQPAPPLGRAH